MLKGSLIHRDVIYCVASREATIEGEKKIIHSRGGGRGALSSIKHVSLRA